MRKLLIIGALLAVAAVPSLGGANPLPYFIVPADSQALVLQGDQIVRKADAGMHLYNPQTEQVVIEPVFKENKFSFDTPFDIQGCAAIMVLLYQIGDLEAYYLNGRDLAALSALRSDIVTALAGLPERAVTLDGGRVYVSGFSNQLGPLNGDIAGGLLITRINVSLPDDCTPQRVVRETPVDAGFAPTVGDLANERTEPVDIRVTTADGVQLQINGFAPTFDVVDASAVATCFGQSPNAAAFWASNTSKQVVADVTKGLRLDQLAEVSAQLPAALDAANFAQCGLRGGGVDFSETTVIQRTIVDCDEGTAEICRPN